MTERATMFERLENQQIEIRRLRAAMAELLAGHDNLYRAHWGYLPSCDPRNDLAAKAARALLEFAECAP